MHASSDQTELQVPESLQLAITCNAINLFRHSKSETFFNHTDCILRDKPIMHDLSCDPPDMFSSLLQFSFSGDKKVTKWVEKVGLYC